MIHEHGNAPMFLGFFRLLGGGGRRGRGRGGLGRLGGLRRGLRGLLWPLRFRMLFGERSHGRDLPHTRIAPSTCIEHEHGLRLGDHVFIGHFNLIEAGAGVTIGDGAIIGTRAQVTKDVPAYAVVAGNPGRVVKMRFPPEIVAELLAIRWWDWDADRIARHIDAIQGADIDALRAAV